MLDRMDPLELTLKEPLQIYQQISEQVRALILSRELPPGMKLPPTKELALKWKVPAASVQAALAPLVKEGFLVRIRKKGTFVIDRNLTLERVGMYYDTAVWRTNSLKQAVHVELIKLCDSKGIKLETFFDSRKPQARATPLLEVVQAASIRRIQALIATDVAVDEAAWIDRLPIPTAVFVEADHPTKVDHDFNQFLDLSLGRLKEQGCRSAGIISLRGPSKPAAGRAAATAGEFLRLFSKFCARHEISTRDEWIKGADEFVVEREAQEKFGYDQLLRIWQLPVRPEGLIVYPNTTSVGVITGALEKRLEIPRDLKLVLHKHKELDYLCPLPVSFVMSSVAHVAQALLKQIMRQFRGEPRTAIIVPFLSNVESSAAHRVAPVAAVSAGASPA